MKAVYKLNKARRDNRRAFLDAFIRLFVAVNLSKPLRGITRVVFKKFGKVRAVVKSKFFHNHAYSFISLFNSRFCFVNF